MGFVIVDKRKGIVTCETPVFQPGGPESHVPPTSTEKQLRAIFMECDINKDGVLSKKELKRAFRRLGALIPAFRAARGLHHADANHDGVVDMDELDDLIKYAY
ncbi:PREDICTED: calmodulin-like protein 5, partial [Populus euphratica]